MSDRDAQAEEDVDDQAPDREFPISSFARFTVGGKPLALDDFVDITTGDVANRPLMAEQPQPTPMPKPVVWNARRPVED